MENPFPMKYKTIKPEQQMSKFSWKAHEQKSKWKTDLQSRYYNCGQHKLLQNHNPKTPAMRPKRRKENSEEVIWKLTKNEVVGGFQTWGAAPNRRDRTQAKELDEGERRWQKGFILRHYCLLFSLLVYKYFASLRIELFLGSSLFTKTSPLAPCLFFS